MAHKKWVVRQADKDRATAISEKFNIDPLIAYMLTARGMDDDITASKFLADSYETVSPFNFADMEEAAFTVGDAIDCGEKICIYGDYDCDGVMQELLRCCGYSALSALRSYRPQILPLPDRSGVDRILR